MSRYNSKVVLILAAGEAQRFHGVCKQLLNLGSETIIERIIRQSRDRGFPPYVVTTNENIYIALSHSELMYCPKSHKVTCDTFIHTQELWDDRTIILLGDVIYSKRLIDTIFECVDPIKVFGNTWEVFAISFSNDVRDKVVETLVKANKTYPSKLRTFYKLYCGFHPEEPEIQGSPLETVILDFVRDWSLDIDSLEQYENMVREVINPSIIDDLP